jgi:hypothetical protein
MQNLSMLIKATEIAVEWIANRFAVKELNTPGIIIFRFFISISFIDVKFIDFYQLAKHW